MLSSSIGIKTIANAEHVCLISADPLYVSLFPDGLTKEQIEDQQIMDWLYFMCSTALIEAPISLSIGDDPPDRKLVTKKGTLGIELRQLTLFSIRKELAPFRDYGQKIRTAILNQHSNYKHLFGRRIHLTYNHPMIPIKGKTDTKAILTSLKRDLGTFGEDISPHDPLPKKWPKTAKGFYGEAGGFTVQVYADGKQNEILVSCGVQSEIRPSEAIKAICEAVNEKDIECNQVVLITCGLPDSRGFQCPPDQVLFHQISLNREQIKLKIKPKFLKSVLIKLFWGRDGFEIYRNPDFDLPWKEY